MTMPQRTPVHVVTGEDASLLSHRTTAIVDRLCGQDRSLLLVEAAPEADLRQLLRSVPMFTEFQVVLLRRTLEEDVVKFLVEYLKDPEPTTVLVISAAKVPASLSKAARAAGGEVLDTSPKKPAEAARDLVSESGVDLDARARQFLIQHVGEEVSRLPMLLSTIASVYGTGSRVTLDQLEPFLGDAGGVPPWDLTDAVDRGDAQGAIRVLHRMLRSRAPIVVLISLQNHVERLFRLSEAGVRSEREAAEFLGLKGSTYPAKKALSTLPRWRDLHDAMRLVGDAAEDLRGGSTWPPELVLEVLTARLALRR